MQHIHSSNIMDLKSLLHSSLSLMLDVKFIFIVLTRYIRIIEVLHNNTKKSVCFELGFLSYTMYILLFCNKKYSKGLVKG